MNDDFDEWEGMPGLLFEMAYLLIFILAAVGVGLGVAIWVIS